MGGYVGRFAPSPSGPLHAGSLVAALGSWLDARCAGGTWLVRIEDVDTRRCVAGADCVILRQLAACGLRPDGVVLHQAARGAVYEQALQRLLERRDAYPCSCSRRDIEAAAAVPGSAGLRVYPGTCRDGARGAPRAWRMRLPQGEAARVRWHCARLGPQVQRVDREVGDFVLKRADGDWAYQLAVVVDDAAQGVSDVVRGEDLADSTARQMLLQRALGLPTPRYLHLPLLRDRAGRKVSKSEGAAALRPGVQALRDAAAILGLRVDAATPQRLLLQALHQWPGRLRAWQEAAAQHQPDCG